MKKNKKPDMIKDKFKIDLKKSTKKQLIELLEWTIDVQNKHTDKLLKREIYEGLWNKGIIVLLGLLFALEQFINQSWIFGSLWISISLAWIYMFVLKLKMYRSLK